MQVVSEIRFGEKVVGGTDSEVATEQMVRAMAMDQVMARTDCPLTQLALHSLAGEWWDNPSQVVVDTRVHMLMKGWYPCIPGFHHDDVPRGENGQPDYDSRVRTEHAIFLYNAPVAPTQFALGRAEFSEPSDHSVIYKEWHKEVQEKLAAGELQSMDCPDRQWLYFDDRTWHQGVDCKVKFGHRMFIRVARSYIMLYGRKCYLHNKFSNEIRRNAQVYMDNPMQGW